MAGTYLTLLMETELTDHLGRDRYERSEESANHRNVSYPRKYVTKGDWKGLDQSSPGSPQYFSYLGTAERKAI